jgi:hypothetical protein
MKPENTPNQENVTKGEETALLEPYRRDVFETYIVWKSIPALLKMPPASRHTGTPSSPKEFCKVMGIENEQIIALAGIRSQTQFAEHFGVHINTLTDWNKLIAKRDPLSDLRHWATGLTKNVLMSLYHKVLQNGDAERVKLWFQIVEGWSEKSIVGHDHKVITAIEYRIIEPEIPNDVNEPSTSIASTL